jgi:hypothetical protein
MLILVSTGCVSISIGGPGAVTGRGAPEIFEIEVGEYSAIRIEGFCDVKYYSAPSDTVTLEVQPNLREYFRVEVRNGELVLSTTRRINLNRAPVLTVSAPSLEGLSIAGAGMFTAHDPITSDSFTLRLSGAGTGTARLDVNSVYAELSGAGSFTLSGRADTAEMTMSGLGELDAIELAARNADVRLNGAGAISVNASENLRINAGGMGSVIYKGGASVDINQSGMVSVKRLD